MRGRRCHTRDVFERIKGLWGATERSTPAPEDPTAAFRERLQRYPAHRPPHGGFARDLTPPEAQQNLDWFNGSIDARQAALRELLSEYDVALPAPAGLDPTEAESTVARLIAWTRRHWPDQPYRPEHLEDDHWLHCDRVGDDAIFSLTLDLATYFGEIARAARPEWRWGLDLARSSLRGPMLASRRVLLCTAPLGPRGVRVQEDWEALVVTRYRRPGHFLFQGGPDADAWMVRLRDCCTGRVIDLYEDD